MAIRGIESVSYVEHSGASRQARQAGDGEVLRHLPRGIATTSPSRISTAPFKVTMRMSPMHERRPSCIARLVGIPTYAVSAGVGGWFQDETLRGYATRLHRDASRVWAPDEPCGCRLQRGQSGSFCLPSRDGRHAPLNRSVPAASSGRSSGELVRMSCVMLSGAYLPSDDRASSCINTTPSHREDNS